MSRDYHGRRVCRFNRMGCRALIPSSTIDYHEYYHCRPAYLQRIERDTRSTIIASRDLELKSLQDQMLLASIDVESKALQLRIIANWLDQCESAESVYRFRIERREANSRTCYDILPETTDMQSDDSCSTDVRRRRKVRSRSIFRSK